MPARFDRRDILRLLALSPAALAAAAGLAPLSTAVAEPEITPPGEQPFVPAAGEGLLPLMPDTPYETPLYVFASGRPGPIALVLGGVHGNEPGGWLAAEWVAGHLRPENGALLVAPRANRVAVSLFQRTTPALGDLNRSYPGFEDGLPMERMALSLISAMREFQVQLVHDMHESWAFYRDRTTNGTAFLGQTVGTNGEAGWALANAVIDRVNAAVLADQELFYSRDPSRQQPGEANLPRQTSNLPQPGRGTSSLGLNRFLPGLVSLLVEMGQQQAMERRIALHVQVLEAAIIETGMGYSFV
jgi:hypothetical protein